MKITDLAADAQDRGWLESLIYYLLESKCYDYCYALHNIDVIAVNQPFGFCNGYPVPAMVGIDESTYQISILLYWPIVSRLSTHARIQLIQHETLHVVEGHLSLYGERLVNVFGQLIANMAMDIYVNQRMDRSALIAEGLVGVCAEQYSLPLGLSSYDYAVELQKLKDDNKLGNDGAADITVTGNDPQAGTSGKEGDDFTGKGVPGIISEIIDLNGPAAAIANEKVKTILQNVSAALKAVNSEWSRGFGGADQEELIKASQKETDIPWSTYIRAMETKYRADFIVPTRRRPSRRHPAHLGRVRRTGLEVAFLIDTSGSMGLDELKLVEPELKGLHARGAHITVIHCDAKVAKVYPYTPYDQLEKFYGRGGTEYSDAFVYLRSMVPMPGFIVCFTDGYGGIEEYKKLVIQEKGVAWWDAYEKVHPEESPDGLITLWLIPEGCMTPAEFTKDIVPWGTAIQVKRDVTNCR